jgi:response regulator RpfG family c-di-GMP phosphodiesterase
MAHIKEQSGTHFDPQVIDAFIKIIDGDKKLEQKPKKTSE